LEEALVLAEIKAEVKEMREDMTEIKLTLERIGTVLSERQHAVAKNQENIGEAFNEINALKNDFVQRTLEVNDLKNKVAAVEADIREVRQVMSELKDIIKTGFQKQDSIISELKDTNTKHGVLYAIVASVLTAGIGAAVLQLFRG
jgi:uncharacterized coiled-coil DUF342 family protein